MVALDGVAEGVRGRLSVEQVLEVVFGGAGEGSFTAVRHSTDGSAGIEGRHARAVEGVRLAVAGHDIAGGGDGAAIIGRIRLIVRAG